MIYDAFTYYNEIDLLRTRMIEHSEFVDKFVVVEGDRTFTGAEKRGCLDLSDTRIRDFRDRVILHRVKLDAKPLSAWDNELTQRNAILHAVDFSPSDVLLISDVDELVSRYHWPLLLKSISNCDLVPIRMGCFYYYINLLTPEIYTRQKLVRFRHVLESHTTAHELRMLDIESGSVGVQGFHFSYLGSPTFIIDKVRNFAHQEYNTTKYNSLDHVTRSVATGVDHLGRFGKLRWVPVSHRWPIDMLSSAIWKQHRFLAPSFREFVAGYLGDRRQNLP